MIVAISHPADDHATAVLDSLKRAGHPAVLLDTAKFPVEASVTQHFGAGRSALKFWSNGLNIDFTKCHVAWWRRPQPYTLHHSTSADTFNFAYTECHEAIAGLWSALDVTWVNQPQRDEAAHHKPYQLAVAMNVGMPVPRTLITNDPGQARKFIDEIGVSNTVYKTFMATEQCWRETRILRTQELEILDQVRLAPVIFQEYIPAVSDIRVTVVGTEMFAAAISAAPGGYALDYRMDLEAAQFEPTQLSGETVAYIRKLMQRLGLLYGAIDLRRTRDRGDVFLEVNPAGEWRFVEERTNQPITHAFAELLSRLDCSRDKMGR